jgi:hypothetical protein
VSDNLKTTIKFLFSLLTFSIIVQALYYIFHYSGKIFIFSNEQLEGFRIHGKPFVYFSLSFLQIIFLLWIPYVIRKSKISYSTASDHNMDPIKFDKMKQDTSVLTELYVGSRLNINVESGGYYSVMGYLLDEKNGGWNGFSKEWRSTTISALRVQLADDWNEGNNLIKFVKKVKFRFYLITLLMFFLPLINLVINLIYIYEYTFTIDLPLPDVWLNHIQTAIGWLEKLWQNPVIAIAFCLIEIAIAIYIYYRMFGLPSPVNFFKSIFSKF